MTNIRNIGLSVYFFPFNWSLSADKYFRSAGVNFGPFSIYVEW